jgi:hypothetical protein
MSELFFKVALFSISTTSTKEFKLLHTIAKSWYGQSFKILGILMSL